MSGENDFPGNIPGKLNPKMSAPMSLPPLTIVGSINVDLTFYCNNFPSAGETINGVSFSKAFGGKVS